jgi:hypothetical protein
MFPELKPKLLFCITDPYVEDMFKEYHYDPDKNPRKKNIQATFLISVLHPCVFICSWDISKIIFTFGKLVLT